MLLDVNILLYWLDVRSPFYPLARRLLHQATALGEMVGVPWVTTLGFLRIATNRRLAIATLETSQAVDAAERLLGQPNVWIPQPGPQHVRLLGELAAKYNLSGASLTDAHLAALAIEHKLAVVSFDRGFDRFNEIRWFNPASTT